MGATMDSMLRSRDEISVEAALAAGLSEASTPLKPAKPEAEPKVAAEPKMGVGEVAACNCHVIGSWSLPGLVVAFSP